MDKEDECIFLGYGHGFLVSVETKQDEFASEH